VINGFERIVAGVGAREAFFTSLLENPKSLLRICRLLSLSGYLSEILFESPEVIDFLMDDSRLGRPQRVPFTTGGRKLQEFYTGAQYFFGVTLRRGANRVLTRFAEHELRRVLPDQSQVAIFAAGKLGERELNFRSDLDVIAFYEGDYDSSLETVENLVRQLAPQFKVDMRLRPEGKKGSLVWSPERYREYVLDRGETWERMALTKARFVAGDPALGETIREIVESFVYDRPFRREQIEEMNAIRARMENEIGRETDNIWDLKVGRGGIVDIEFLVEYRQIQENVRIPSTVLAMKRIGLNLLEEYEFLRDVESMLRLWSPLASTCIEEQDREALGLMLHLKDFAADYKRITEAVRRRFENANDAN
jgi:glutamate-ammonia-ligase adenylyltransferase